MSATFALQLSFVAPLAELRAAFEAAAPRARFVYASGIDLPREADAVRQVAAWADEGLARLFQRRDPEDSRRWQWIVEKSGVGVPSQPVEITSAGSCCHDVELQMQKARLLGVLEHHAKLDGTCPSNAELAQKLGLAGEAGKRRARYVLAQLEAEGRITLTNRGRNAARLVEVVDG